MFRQAVARNVRLFSTTPAFRKGPVETAKDAAKSVDRTVSDTIVKGIEKGGKHTCPSCSSCRINANGRMCHRGGRRRSEGGRGRRQAKGRRDSRDRTAEGSRGKEGGGEEDVVDLLEKETVMHI